MRPKLYWISGSPPAWRVMIALTLKQIPFDHKQLDHTRGENKTPAYLALNPKGQVPTLTCGKVVIRESLAILAWLDRASPDRPIWGKNQEEAVLTWRRVILFEVDLGPVASHIGRGLQRGIPVKADAVRTFVAAMTEISGQLEGQPFIGGDQPTTADIWLYPTVHWIMRSLYLAGNSPAELANFPQSHEHLNAWLARFRQLPGIEQTYPPHWKEGT